MTVKAKAWTRWILGTALVVGTPAGIASADDDSSADADGGFGQVIEASSGVMIRVPINEQGDEDTNAAEIRVHKGEAVTDGADLRAAWDASTDASQQPVVGEDSSTDTDSSTSHYGWNRWSSWGWQSGNYYYNYRPYYSYYGNHYNYYQPYYYTYYRPYNNYYGYRYYYYNRYW